MMKVVVVKVVAVVVMVKVVMLMKVVVVVVMVLSTIGLVWMFNQGPEPEPVEFRTVYSAPGWEHSFESIKEFLPQPQSALGYTWSLVALLDGEFNAIGADSSMEMIVGGGPGLLAVGSSRSSPAVWSSVDGATWSRALGVDNASGTGYNRWMSAVVVGGPGLVAVGGERPIRVDPSGTPIDNDRYDDDDAAVWTSVDGSTWTRVPHNDEAFGSAASCFCRASTCFKSKWYRLTLYCKQVEDFSFSK